MLLLNTLSTLLSKEQVSGSWISLGVCFLHDTRQLVECAPLSCFAKPLWSTGSLVEHQQQQLRWDPPTARPHCRLHSALPPISAHPTSKWLYFRHRERVTWKHVRVANTVSVETPGMLIPCRRWKIHVIGISFSKTLLTCKGNITFQF